MDLASASWSRDLKRRRLIDLEKVVFKKSGVGADGDALYDLWIAGELVRSGLTMDEVVQQICGPEEPDRNPPRIRTPEDRRGRLQRR